MKKIVLAILMSCCSIWATSAQDYNFTAPNTGANHTLMIFPEASADLANLGVDNLGAFLEVNDSLICVGACEILEGNFAIALWGNDANTEDVDGLADGQSPIWAALDTEGGVHLLDATFSGIPTWAGWTLNGINYVEGFSSTDYLYYDCTNPAAFNYDAGATWDDESCYFDPGCTDTDYAQYHNQGFVADFDNGSCADLAVFYCADPSFIDHYNSDNIIDGTIDANVSDENLCLTVAAFYCADDSFDEYYLSNNVAEGAIGGNMIDNSLCASTSSFYCNNPLYDEYYTTDDKSDGALGGSMIDANLCDTAADFYCNDASFNEYYNGASAQDIDGGSIIDNTLCFTQAYLYCNNPSFDEYYLSDNILDGDIGGTIIDESLCVSPVDFYCSDANYDEYYNGSSVDDVDGGSIIDQSLCINLSSFYCNNPLYDEYYQGADVAEGAQGGSIINNDLCTTASVFYCSDENFAEYYASNNILDGAHGGTMVDDGLCQNSVDYYCSDDSFVEFFANAGDISQGPEPGNIIDDALCIIPKVLGCMSDDADNYNALANMDDLSVVYTDPEGNSIGISNTLCEYAGCKNPAASNFCFDCNVIENLTCVVPVEFESVITGVNMSILIPVSSGAGVAVSGTQALEFGDQIGAFYGGLQSPSCGGFGTYNPNEASQLVVWGADPGEDNGFQNGEEITWLATIYDELSATTSVYELAVELSNGAIAYSPNGMVSIISIEVLGEYSEGCTNPDYANFEAWASQGDAEILCAGKLGCTDTSYANFDAEASVDNASCMGLFGCLDDAFDEYNALANTDDGSCISITGCMLAYAVNYNSLANNPSACDLGAGYLGDDNSLINLPENGDLHADLMYLQETMYPELVEELENTIADYNAQISTMQNSYDTHIDSLNEYFSTQISTLISDYDEEVLALQIINGNLSSSNDSLQSILDNTVYQLTNANTELSQANVAFSEANTSLTQVNEDLQVQLDSMSTSFNNNLAEVLETAQSQNDSLANSNSFLTALNQSQAAEFQFSLDSLNLAHQTELNQEEAVYANAINTIMAAFVEQADAPDPNSENPNSIAFAIAELELLFSQEIINHAQSVSDYNQQIADLNSLHLNETTQINSQATADSLAAVVLLNNTITSYDSQITNLNTSHTSELQALSLGHESQLAILAEEDSLEDLAFEQQIAYYSAPLSTYLGAGWNMIGYYLQEPTDVAAQTFDIVEDIALIKNNAGGFYWPDFSFNGIGEFIPGQGYQVRMDNEVLDFDFQYTSERIELTPMVPQWAQDMEVEIHPNDIRSLVRVVNMLGQEVNPEYMPRGTTLLYLFNDGTVEKKMTK